MRLTRFLEEAKDDYEQQAHSTDYGHCQPHLLAVSEEQLCGGRRQRGGCSGQWGLGWDWGSAWHENRWLRGSGDRGSREVAGWDGGVCPTDEQYIVDIDFVCFGAVAVEHHDLTARDAISSGNHP